MQIIYQQISGPFGWPDYENTKDKLPTTSGLYLTTFETNDGLIPWGLGVTSRPVRVRFLEHSRNFKARRNKTSALKQGMMQELLTGRTRLV